MPLADNQARFVRQAIAGLAWLVTWAWIISASTGYSFAVLFPTIAVLLVGATALATWWLANRVALEGPRARQFGIITLLVAMVFVAAVLGVARWAVGQNLARRGLEVDDNATIAVAVVAVCLSLMLLVSVPLMLSLLDSLLHLAIWLLRRFVRR